LTGKRQENKKRPEERQLSQGITKQSHPYYTVKQEEYQDEHED